MTKKKVNRTVWSDKKILQLQTDLLNLYQRVSKLQDNVLAIWKVLNKEK